MDTKQLNDRQQLKGRQLRQARLEIVSEQYKRSKSIRQIAEAVKIGLELKKPPSTQTIFSDIQLLLNEWREYRVTNTDELIQLELERIDDAITELWEAWDKSKIDYTEQQAKQKGAPTKDNQTGETKTAIYQTEQQRKEIKKFGDVGYISEIRMQLQERRKLLGLYAPDKRELTGAHGQPLNPADNTIKIEDLTNEELEIIYKIASKRDKRE